MSVPNYTSPCLKCQKAADHRACGEGSMKGCNEWRKWFFWWWKYFRTVTGTPSDKRLSMDCDIPCSAYEAWFVTKWDETRKQVGM